MLKSTLKIAFYPLIIVLLISTFFLLTAFFSKYPKQFTDTQYDEGAPSWSPDGTRIAYTALEQGINKIWIKSLNENNALSLKTSLSSHFFPSWSPDGQEIVFQSNASGNSDLWIYSFKTGQVRQVTFDLSSDILPKWSSDGQEIAFVSNRSGNRDIWIISPKGGRATQITRRNFLKATATSLNRSGWLVIDRKFAAAKWLADFDFAYERTHRIGFGTYYAIRFTPKIDQNP